MTLSEAIYASAFGASYARQAHDRIKGGHGPPDEKWRARIGEEADAIAQNAVEESQRWNLPTAEESNAILTSAGLVPGKVGRDLLERLRQSLGEE